MKPEALAFYKQVIVSPAFVAAHLACNLCGHKLWLNDRAGLIPMNQEETHRMREARPYVGVLAHYTCLEKMP